MHLFNSIRVSLLHTRIATEYAYHRDSPSSTWRTTSNESGAPAHLAPTPPHPNTHTPANTPTHPNTQTHLATARRREGCDDAIGVLLSEEGAKAVVRAMSEHPDEQPVQEQVCLFVCLSVCLYLSVSVCLYTCTCVHVSVSVCLCLCVALIRIPCKRAELLGTSANGRGGLPAHQRAGAAGVSHAPATRTPPAILDLLLLLLLLLLHLRRGRKEERRLRMGAGGSCVEAVKAAMAHHPAVEDVVQFGSLFLAAEVRACVCASVRATLSRRR